MLRFEKVRFKNFLSYGNAPTEFALDAPGVTLITGANGSGKTSVIDAICFALFGKSYRKITKDSLINDINKKNCVVELFFNDGVDDYHVTRGIKPNVFRINRNGKEVESQTSVTDFQDWFETNVIRMNYATFCQIIVLGSSNYTPFMQLKTAERREVVDSMLDTHVFGDMGKVLGEKLRTHNQEGVVLEGEANVLKAKIETHEAYATRAQETVAAEILALKTRLSEIRSEIEKNEEAVTEKKDIHEALSAKVLAFAEKKQTRDSLISDGITLNQKLATIKERIKFFEDTDVCATCEQKLDAGHVHDSITPLKEQMVGIRASIKTLRLQIETLNTEIEELETIREQLVNLNREILVDEMTSQGLLREGKQILGSIAALKGKEAPSESVEVHRTELEVNQQKMEAHVKEKRALSICAALLKDTGIKASIIKNYIPTINLLVKKYLDLFDFYPRVEFDENFNEKITLRSSPYEYNQFSMGQRTRLNLAMLFTWREIARLRAQASCNLLFFDEIFDSSLDAQGAEDLMVILAALGEVSIFIISHRGEQFAEKIDRHITVELTNNFSRNILN